MVDLALSRRWFPELAAKMRKVGLAVKVSVRPEAHGRPNLVVEVTGARSMGVFEAWESGEADYTVFHAPSRSSEILHAQRGLALTDANFKNTFMRFAIEMRRAERR